MNSSSINIDVRKEIHRKISIFVDNVFKQFDCPKTIEDGNKIIQTGDAFSEIKRKRSNKKKQKNFGVSSVKGTITYSKTINVYISI